MADVELRQLRTFTAVVEGGSFGRAAARLGYTQSTVSQQLANLERTIGGRVFDRPGGPRRVQLTPLGQVVYAHAGELLARTSTMLAAVERFNAGEGRLTIGTFQSVSNTLLPVLVRRLRDEFPKCEIRLSEDESSPPDLAQVDLLFHDLRIDDVAIEQIKVFDDPYYLVSPRGHFPGDVIDVATLDGEPLIAWPPDCAQPALEESLAHRGINPKVVFRATSNEAVLAMVRAGLGSTILPWLAIHGGGATSDSALSIHALHPGVAHREIYLMRPAHRTASPLTARAIQLTTEIAQELQKSQ